MSNIILSFSELNKLKSVIYATEVAHGFHDEKHTVDHELGMVLSEIGEAIDAFQHDGTPLSRLLEADDDVDIRQLSDGHLARYRDNASNDFIDANEELCKRGL